jgi:signal transduction histidine kinase
MGTSGMFGYLRGVVEDKEKTFLQSYDKERRYRYELEQAKAKLLNSSMEVAHVAEISERNRIAREIHDNVGHSIAGILMQLQASYKLSGKDDKKSIELLKKSIDELSNSLTILRDTVHNIKPQESMGIEYIKNVIDNFSFCDVDFNYSGDFNNLSPNLLQIIYTNIKEALTNISRHSNATRVDIAIDINERFIRLYIKDNGVGCNKIKEGLGISGMRERVKNIGGSISINTENGFLIVCVIPRELKEGVGIFESTNSR